METNSDSMDLHTQRSIPPWQQTENDKQNYGSQLLIDANPLNLSTKYFASNISEAQSILASAGALKLSNDLAAAEALRQPRSCKKESITALLTFPLNLANDSVIDRLEKAANDLRYNGLVQSKYFYDEMAKLFRKMEIVIQ